METPEASLKFAVVVVLTAVFLAVIVQRRYGPVWPKMRQWLGPRWTLFIKIIPLATLALWVLFFVLVGPEQREDLQRFFAENSPWSR